MAVTKAQVSYEERHELGFLERLIVDPRSDILQLILMVSAIICLTLAVFHLYVSAFGTPEGRSFRSVHLTGMLVLAYFMHPMFRSKIWDPISIPGDPGNGKRWLGFGVDMIAVGLILFVQLYTIYDITAFQLRFGEKDPDDLIVGGILILLVLDATRRAVGWAMVIITSFFMFHALYANHFFGIFYGPPISYGKFVDQLFMETGGIFGIPIHVCSTYIVLFIVFGALLNRSGAGKFFIDLAVALTGHRVGGPAKASAVASGFMGTVSGSAVANVVTTGAFTIPLMKNLGYRARFAAAVEACASSGGQITPPIMGAAAFIMAEFLEVPYVTIIVAAAIPAFLYFATVYFMVHLEAEKHNIERIPKEYLPQLGEVLKRGWHLLISLAILIYFLMAGYTPMKSAFWGISSLFVLSFINKETRMSPADIMGALETGIRTTMPVTIACACAGLIIGSVFVSGLGLKFTQSVIDLSGGNLFILLSLTGIAAVILGMGLTTTAVYITVAALIVPAVIKAGVEPIAAHMFAFYFGVVSSITPPVALASFAAAGIAKTPPMMTAVESTRVGIAKFLVPLIFAYNPSLLFVGPISQTLISAVLTMIGLWVLSASIEGWYRGRLNTVGRVITLIAAIMVLWPPEGAVFGIPDIWIELGGVGLALVYLLPRHLATRGNSREGMADA
ncbi:MAG: TRAP transporter permease [Rhodospirillaceae bacterium]